MKKLVVILSMFACSAALAAPPTTESVERLLVLSKGDKLLEVAYASMERSMRQSMQTLAGSRPLTPEQQKAIRTLPERMMQFLRQEMSWAAMKPLIVPVYVQTFDQEEIDGMISFFSSPIGQRFVDKQAVVAERSAAAVQQLMTAALPRLQAAMASALKESEINTEK